MAQAIRFEDAALERHTREILHLLHEQEQTAARALELAIALGEALQRAKAIVGHGRWSKWLAQHWPRSQDRAEAFMQLAAHAEAVRALPPDTSLNAATALIREQRRLDRPAPLVPIGPRAGASWEVEQWDARRLPFEDGVGHRDRHHGAPCAAPTCPHPMLWLGSPPYNARLKYDGYTDWLPWDEWWDGLIVPVVREGARVLAPGGRMCLNLANVARADVGESFRERTDVPRGPHDSRPKVRFRSRGGKKWCPPGAGGESWAYLLAPRIWRAITDAGLLEREQLTWVKGEDPANVVTTSTAWGSWCSPENPVLRAVAEPVFIASKGSHARGEKRPGDIPDADFKRLTRNVWFIPNEGGVVSRVGQHPCPWPTQLPSDLMLLYTYPEDLVVDPVQGLAAAGEAAIGLGRRYRGGDISQVYVDRAAARLRTLA